MSEERGCGVSIERVQVEQEPSSDARSVVGTVAGAGAVASSPGSGLGAQGDPLHGSFMGLACPGRRDALHCIPSEPYTHFNALPAVKHTRLVASARFTVFIYAQRCHLLSAGCKILVSLQLTYTS